MERLEALQVGNARDQGWTWEQIAQLLGVTRQAVHKEYAGGRGPLRRRTEHVRTVHARGPADHRAGAGGGGCPAPPADRHRAPAPGPGRPGHADRRRPHRYGLTRTTVLESITALVGDLDAAALTTLGIDLDAVRERVESAFGAGALDDPARRHGATSAGHVPFNPRAKKVLELSLREALALEHRHIADGHIALGLLREGEGLAMKILADRGIDAVALRREITAALAS